MRTSSLHLKKEENLTYKAGCAVPSEGLGALVAGVAHTLCPFPQHRPPFVLVVGCGRPWGLTYLTSCIWRWVLFQIVCFDCFFLLLVHEPEWIEIDVKVLTEWFKLNQNKCFYYHCSSGASSLWRGFIHIGSLSQNSLRMDFIILYTNEEGFPGSSAGKESTCNAGDPRLIPGSGRSTGERIVYPL